MSARAWKRMDSAGKIQAWPLDTNDINQRFPLVPPFVVSQSSMVTIANYWGVIVMNLEYLCCIIAGIEVFVLDSGLANAYIEDLGSKLRSSNNSSENSSIDRKTPTAFQSLALASGIDEVWRFLGPRAANLVGRAEVLRCQASNCCVGDLPTVRIATAQLKQEISSTYAIARNIQSALYENDDGGNQDLARSLCAYKPLLAGINQGLKHCKKSTIECVEEVAKSRMAEASAKRETSMLVIAAATFCITSVFNSITGLFGMNVPNGHETDDNMYFGKIIVICTGASLGLLILSLVLFKRLEMVEGLLARSRKGSK
ncbi:hypothetical protein SELMODRAFT_411304 [Selaginella moellendorffii]|uniref:Uncharacterized protein n=1 Tax=Selaginella moellendorffii TaxID=88036 RepID=D8RH78_SELML|nr:hypothetical protein SELMODRAFT_411304 [Selaginella moellendorffii]